MKRRRKVEFSPMWECPVCIKQMVGGPRCAEHNPTPEQRAANPQAYRHEGFMPNRKEVSRAAQL